jgi:hypothetical protein
VEVDGVRRLRRNRRRSERIGRHMPFG